MAPPGKRRRSTSSSQRWRARVHARVRVTYVLSLPQNEHVIVTSPSLCAVNRQGHGEAPQLMYETLRVLSGAQRMRL